MGKYLLNIINKKVIKLVLNIISTNGDLRISSVNPTIPVDLIIFTEEEKT